VVLVRHSGTKQLAGVIPVAQIFCVSNFLWKSYPVKWVRWLDDLVNDRSPSERMAWWSGANGCGGRDEAREAENGMKWNPKDCRPSYVVPLSMQRFQNEKQICGVL
jgi:hypothetical protein